MMTQPRTGLLGLLAFLVGAAIVLLGPRASAQQDSTLVALDPGAVIWVPVSDVIGPISASYVTDAIRHAEQKQAAAVVIELDTPGGLDTAMRQIIKSILASEVPVCVYVAPEGARAAVTFL